MAHDTQPGSSLSEASDAVLLTRLRQGDHDAFDAIYDRHRARLFSFLARLSRDRTIAEDLMQETFLRLARSAPDPQVVLRAWLFRVGRNLFVDGRRRALLDFERLRDLALWPSRPRIATETPFDHLEANQTQRRLEAALLALPLKYREALLLVAVERLSPTEAAQILEIAPPALRQRLLRGRALLRDALRDTLPDLRPERAPT